MPPSPGRGVAPRGRLLHLVHGLLLALAVWPAAATATLVLRTQPNVPFWDQWQLTEMLVASDARGLGLADFWAPHNEHRIPVPRAIHLALARASDWDVRLELALVLALAGATLLCVAHVARRTAAPALAPWLIALAAVLLFSPAQWESFVWGWSLQIFLAQLAAALVAVVLVHARGRPRDVALALGAAALGALSHGTGLVLLAVVPVALLLAPRGGPRRRRLAHAAVAAAFGALLIALYFHDLPLRPERADLERGSALATLGDLAGFALGWIGAGAGSRDPAAAFVLGVAGLASFAALAALAWTRSRDARAALAPWLALALFAVLASGLIAAGRLGFGYEQALVPRYVTFSALFWVAWLATATIALTGALERARRAPVDLAAAAAVAAGCLALAARAQVEAWGPGRAEIRRHALLLEHGAMLMRDRELAPDAAFEILFPDGPAVRAWARELERLRLGPYAEPAPPLERLADHARLEPPALAGFVEASVADPMLAGCRCVTGWAVDPTTQGPVEAVLAVHAGRVVARARPTAERPDVVAALGLACAFPTAFEVHVPEFALAPDGGDLRLYALLAGGRVAPLAGKAVLAGDEVAAR